MQHVCERLQFLLLWSPDLIPWCLAVQIRLKIDKTKEDIEAEQKRRDLLASLNEMYE